MKKRILACALACAMLLMGTGYAYWTDLLNVSVTAETGKLDVDFTSASYFDNNFEETGALTDESAYDSTTHPRSADIQTGLNDLSIPITELYPGHYQIYKAEVDNTGTVAAKLSKITKSVGGDTNAAKMVGVAIIGSTSYDVTQKKNFVRCTKYRCNQHEHITDCWGNKYYVVYGEHVAGAVWSETETTPVTSPDLAAEALGIPAADLFVIDGITFVRLSALKDINPSTNLLYLTNNSKLNLTLFVGMDPDASGTYTTGSAATRNANSDLLTQDKTATLTLGFVWDQYNE